MTLNEDLKNSPKRVSGDEGTVEERDADDAIQLDIYDRVGKVTGPPYGMRVARCVPRGTVPIR